MTIFDNYFDVICKKSLIWDKLKAESEKLIKE